MNTPTTVEASPMRLDLQLQPEQAEQPLTVLQQAIRTGATADQLERLLDLQVRHDNHKLELLREQRKMAEEDRKAAAEAAFRHDFAAFRGENVIIPKSKYVDRGKAGSFMQAEYSAVADLLSPKLSKHGFSFRHDVRFGAKPWTTDGVVSDIPWVYVTCYLEHRQGHRETLDLEGPPGDLHANTAVQNMQATASYLKRQSLLAITGTATAEEDDEAKLRSRKGSEGHGTDALETLRATGQDKAMEGSKALTAWWGTLNAKQRNDLSPDFKGWRQAAALADQHGGGNG